MGSLDLYLDFDKKNSLCQDKTICTLEQGVPDENYRGKANKS